MTHADRTNPNEPPASGHALTAGRSGRAWVVLALVALVGLGLDLGTKWAAFRFVASRPVLVDRARVLQETELSRLIPLHEPIRVVPGVLDLTLVLNRGAVFGMGAGRRWFFVTFTLVALGAGLWVFARRTRPSDRLAHLALGLLLAGGLGNLYDRLVYACVRDFLHPLPGVVLPFGWTLPGGRTEVWPYVSNVADLLLLIGIAMLMWHLWTLTPAPGVRAEPRSGRA